MKKIVILHPAYWEQAMGGAEIQISYIIEYAIFCGWEVHYIFEDKNMPIVNSNNIIMHPIKKIPFKKKFGSIFPLYHNKIINILKTINPDIVYTRGGYSWTGIAAKYSQLYKKKHVWFIAHDNDPIVKYKIIDIIKPLNIIEKFWLKYSIKYSKTIICQNNYQRNLFEILHKKSCEVITQMSKPEENVIQKDFSKIRILWIANLKPIKRPEIFINLAKSMDITNVEFIMIGKPSSKYNDLIKNNPKLKYIGEISNSDVNKLLCKSHLLINTSLKEGFSNTFIQAWLRKVPVISIDSDPDNIITKQNIGILCNDVNNLETTVKYLVKNKDVLKIMGDKAYNYAIGNHTTKIILPKIFKIFEQSI